MGVKREGLKDLLDNVKYFKEIIDLGPPEKSVLIRHYVSNWQFNKRKSENALKEDSKFRYEKKAEMYWKLYSSLFTDSYNTLNHKA